MGSHGGDLMLFEEMHPRKEGGTHIAPTHPATRTPLKEL